MRLTLLGLWIGWALPLQAGPLQIETIPSPAGRGAGEAFLAADGDAVLMTWLEPAGGGDRLQLSRLESGRWSPPVTVHQSDRMFVNWADFPSVLPLRDGTLVVHWLERSADEPYAYDVLLSQSTDRGTSWTPPVKPHDDGTPTEHGFVSMLADGDGGFVLVWLDGRAFHGEGATREMTLRFARFEAGRFTDATVLDSRVCDCCQTAAARTASGLVVAYRDRSPEEVRDIAYVREEGGRWSEPRALGDDGWRIPACPVNGPALDAAGDEVVVAWHTGAGDERAGSEAGSRGRVQVSFSKDGGRTFAAPQRVDGGRPAGRVDVLRIGPRRALVSWLERTDAGRLSVQARVVRAGGAPETPATIGSAAGGRASGFPRMVLHGDAALIAWTEGSEDGSVQVRRIIWPEASGGPAAVPAAAPPDGTGMMRPGGRTPVRGSR